jgi:hypothetical protein
MSFKVDDDSSNQHGQRERPEPQDDTSGSQPEHGARRSFKQATIEDHIIEDNGGTSHFTRNHYHRVIP